MIHQQTIETQQIQIELKPNGFQEVVIDAIDQVFSSIGSGPKISLYRLLEKKYKLRQENIPERIGDFSNAIEQIFGTGALLLELGIMKKIRQMFPRFEFKAENVGFSFNDFMDSFRRYLSDSDF
jgi:hypothetical protein